MKLNCKEGDTAFVIKTANDYRIKYLGKPLTVLRYAGIQTQKFAGGKWGNFHMWVVKELDFEVEDDCLRPIRPGESKEESIEAMRLLTQVKEKV